MAPALQMHGCCVLNALFVVRPRPLNPLPGEGRNAENTLNGPELQSELP